MECLVAMLRSQSGPHYRGYAAKMGTSSKFVLRVLDTRIYPARRRHGVLAPMRVDPRIQCAGDDCAVG